ncbi:hypothetical protein DGI_0916 [Megalodesulfovibrio gigas DSM 1382 = ATCC 19364]|uniref:Uncharacterized protein n=2 Tax=Megalodesulfovibrio gigas TaxID=879 RepID=T2G889_MEGG1|nr:hypothetical protein DGI_0916 [Megalodesulfovibrio gigas DSM 1382 = ATCC 19364]
MAKKRPLPDNAPRQLLLPLAPCGTKGMRAGMLLRKDAVREALTEALAGCPLSREEVAAELSRLTGEAVSVHHLHSWCSEAKREWRFPLELVTAFCLVTQDFGVLAAVLDGTGQALADKETMTLAEYGRLVAEDKKRAARRRELQERLGV